MVQTLKTIDDKLVSSPFLCGPKMTIGDIVVFNEISQFFEMTGLSTSSPDISQYAFLTKWFTTRMANDADISKHDQEMKAAVAKCTKTMPDN